jgi:hypothetical protein
MDQFNTWGDGESVIKSPQGIQSRKTNSWRFATTLVISLIFYVKWAAAAPWCNTPPPPSLGIIELGFSNSEKRLTNLKSLWKHGKFGSHPHDDPQSKSSVLDWRGPILHKSSDNRPRRKTLISARRFLKEQWEEQHRNLEPTCKFENCHEFLVATKAPRSSRFYIDVLFLKKLVSQPIFLMILLHWTCNTKFSRSKDW